MIYHLAPGVHVAIIGEDAVWLDLPADSYHCTPALNAKQDAQGQVIIEASAAAEALLAAGLLKPSASGQSPRPPPTIATRDVFVPWTSASRLHRPFQEALHLGWIFRRHAYTAPLRRLASIAGRLDRGCADLGEVELIALANGLLEAERWRPWRGACVQRSFHMVCALRSKGVACTWMFGVRTWPFLAHCWVQSGDLALNDSAERLAAFTPILAI